ncbi:MAG TPA: helix-turn-helix transcriptional regulator [Bacteroidia bacterium]
MKSSKEILGRMIKHHREKKGLTLDELAFRIGADRQYIWNLENGRKNMSANYLDRIIVGLESNHECFLVNIYAN